MGQPTGDFRQEGLARPRTGELVSGDMLLTVGGPDGSEARPCPDEWLPEPRRADRGDRARQARTAAALGAAPAVGPRALGSGPTDLPLLDREADIAHLLGMLAEGRSVRLVGQAGSGRSTLLAAVADAAADIAPDGVVRLGGYCRTLADLLQDLFAATHQAPGFRPDRYQLPALLAEVRAVVVIDDVELSGPDLEDLLATAPECAFLISAPPGSPQPALGSPVEDHPVAGLSRPACLALTARLAGRALDEAERAWAVDLWFESEGLPLRFVQAAALLRYRDAGVDTLVAAQEDRHSVFGMVKEIEAPDDPAVLEDELRRSVPLPSVAESTSPALRLAEGLSEPAQAVLRLALAFGGECPTAPHLPALIDVGHGENALHELADCGLAVSVGGHHRLTAGVVEQLTPSWAADAVVPGAAQHFSWWVGHSSVTVEQVAAEAEVVLGAMLADRAAGRRDAVLQLARAAAPALALSLRWGAWERVLQLGLEAARSTGATADEAWFHHELGVLAFCRRTPERAGTELEAAVALRATIGEARGSAAARRMLDLMRADTKELTAGESEPPAVSRRPVIRAIAQVPFRFRTTPGAPGTQARSRTVLAAAAAVLLVGVLGTAIGLSVAGPDSAGGGKEQPGGSLDDGSLTGGISFAIRTPSASPSAAASLSGSSTASASPSATTTGKSSRKPGPSKSSGPTDTPVANPTTPSATRTSTGPAPSQSSSTPPPVSSSPPVPTTSAPTTP